MLRTRLTALALVATALAASGCGSSAKSSTQTTSSSLATSSTQATSPPTTQTPAQSGPLTRATLIAKADEICRRINAKRGTIKITSMQDFVRYLLPLATEERAELAELRRLTPPPSMASDWRAILAGNRTIAADYAKIAEYVRANNEIRGVHGLFAVTARAQARITATARRAGFKDC
jgi:hypothetical protein